MKHFEFNYNKKFSCIAEKCKHNCCIGWEISIDKKTLTNYNLLKEKDARFGDSCFVNNSFNLTKDGRCPFLDNDNLCYIIKNYGEQNLCKTCKTHPRFKNFFSGVTETGLGLYCEHACKIILTNKQKMKLVLVKNDNKLNSFTNLEKKILSFRTKVIKILQNRKLSICQRLEKLQQLSKISLEKNSFNKWLDIYSNLEKLQINQFSFSKIEKQDNFSPILDSFVLEYENILCYLAFRHLSRAIDNLDLTERLAFVVLSFKMINHIFSTIYTDKFRNIDNLVEVCRFYCSEIETSEQNINLLLNEIEKLISFI